MTGQFDAIVIGSGPAAAIEQFYARIERVGVGLNILGGRAVPRH